MTMTTTTGTTTGSPFPLIGQSATTVAAMRVAADLIEQAGVTGLSVTCGDETISVQVSEHLGDAATRAHLVARLAAQVGTIAVRADAHARGSSWVQADGAIGGLAVHIYTAVTVQQSGGLPLAEGPTGVIAQPGPAQPHTLPPGWRWLTHLDPAPDPTGGPVADTPAPGQVA